MRRCSSPVLFNCLGHEMEETDTIAALLEKQVQSGVRWEVTVRRLAELGVDAAIEIGPGRALTGFVKRLWEALSRAIRWKLPRSCNSCCAP